MHGNRHSSHSMRQGLCNGTVSVRPSVYPSYRPLQQRVAGLLLWARRTEDIDRLLHGRRQQHGAQQCRVFSEPPQKTGHKLVLPHDPMLARYLLSSCVRLSVCHNPVLYRNDLTNRAGFCHERFLLPILPHCRPIRRKLGYFRNFGFFPLACTLSQTPPPQVDGVVNETRRRRRRRRRSSLLTKHDNRRLVAVYYVNSVTL